MHVASTTAAITLSLGVIHTIQLYPRPLLSAAAHCPQLCQFPDEAVTHRLQLSAG